MRCHSNDMVCINEMSFECKMTWFVLMMCHSNDMVCINSNVFNHGALNV